MNEFYLRPQNLTVRRIPSTQDCYVSKLDSSTPGPERMEFNMKQVHRFKKSFDLEPCRHATDLDVASVSFINCCSLNWLYRTSTFSAQSSK